MTPPDETNEVRTYTLCPGRTYSIGAGPGGGGEGEEYPLLVFNPNVHIQCDQCVLLGGEVQLMVAPSSSFNGTIFAIEASVYDALPTNVMVSGITFRGLSREESSYVSAYYGDVQFKDCVFTVRAIPLQAMPFFLLVCKSNLPFNILLIRKTFVFPWMKLEEPMFRVVTVTYPW